MVVGFLRWSLWATYVRSVVFWGNSSLLHQYNWPTQYNCNIVQGGIKHHNLNHMINPHDNSKVNQDILKVISVEHTYIMFLCICRRLLFFILIKLGKIKMILIIHKLLPSQTRLKQLGFVKSSMPKFNVTKQLFYELKRASLNHLFYCFSLLLEESISVFFLQNVILVPLVLIVKTSVIHAVTLHVRELTEIVQMAA